MAMQIDVHDNWRRGITGKSVAPSIAPVPAEARDPAFAAALATLTTRERNTLLRTCRGMSEAENAADGFCCRQTVKNTLTHVYRKLGISGGRHHKAARACFLIGRYQADLDGER